MINKLVLDLSPIPTYFFSTPFIADSKPTLPKLLNLKTSSGRTVNILKQIGTHYTTLGPLLLNDDNGAITYAIVRQQHHNADEINRDILTRWLMGRGKWPVTWSTLISVLKDVGLTELAQVIQEALTSSTQSFGETVTC